MSGAEHIALGSVTFGPAPTAEDSMAESIVILLNRLAEVEAERDCSKMAATKLSEPRKGRRKQ